jgi:MacB-like periplasmic core domain
LIFGLANFALLRPLQVREPARLMSLTGMRPGTGGGNSMSYPDVADLRQSRSFDGVTAYFPFVPATISSSGDPQRYWGSIVTANYFDVVQPPFVLGRGFDAARDDRPGEPPVVVISHQLWRSRFDNDPELVGRTVEINRRKVTVIGITAPGFRGTETMFYSDYWIPFSMLDTLADVGMVGIASMIAAVNG